MKGYKAFYFDLSCRPFTAYPMMYEIGKTYEIPGEPVLCKKGFHFCEELPHVYIWYCKAFDIRVCEIEAAGTVLTETDPPKCVTNRIRIGRELEPKEILDTIRKGGPRVPLNFEYDLTDSLRAFYQWPDRYLLWGDRYSPAGLRTPSETEIPWLRERADEWWDLLNGPSGKNTPAEA